MSDVAMNTPSPLGAEGARGAQIDELMRAARRAQNIGLDGEALQAYTQATDLEPNDVLGWLGRSETASDPDERLVSLGYALALEPSNPGLQDRFRARLEQNLERARPEQAERLFLVGRRLALVGLSRAAESAFARVVELDPRHAEAWLWRAGTTGDRNLALSCTVRARELEPFNPAVLAAGTWAQARLETGAASVEANAGTARSADLTPAFQNKTPEELVAEGQKTLQSGNKALALSYFARATELAPRLEQAWLWRATAAEDVDEALTCIDQALAINPDNVQARDVRTMLRMRKLRAGARARPEAASPVGAPRAGASEPAPPLPDRAMRSPLNPVSLLLLLLAVILLIVVAWFFFQPR